MLQVAIWIASKQKIMQDILLLNNCTFLKSIVPMSIHLLDLYTSFTCNQRKCFPPPVMLHVSIQDALVVFGLSATDSEVPMREGRRVGSSPHRSCFLKKVFVNNLTVWAKVINHVKKDPVGDSGSIPGVEFWVPADSHQPDMQHHARTTVQKLTPSLRKVSEVEAVLSTRIWVTEWKFITNSPTASKTASIAVDQIIN